MYYKARGSNKLDNLEVTKVDGVWFSDKMTDMFRSSRQWINNFIEGTKWADYCFNIVIIFSGLKWDK